MVEENNRVKLEVDFDRYKFLVIVITLFITLVIPIQVSEYLKNRPQNTEEDQNSILADQEQFVSETVTDEPRVAGASTSTVPANTVPANAVANAKARPYIFLGAFLIATAGLTIGYLYVENKKYGKEQY